MPAKSKSQQKFMGMVYKAKKEGGKCASPKVKKAAKGMSKKEAKKFAKTKHEGIPEKVKESADSGIISFIDTICDQNYLTASKSLSEIVDSKLKDRINKILSSYKA